MTDQASAAAAQGAATAGLGVGELLDGKYRLERLLGAGGMGWVYQARNEALDALVALKVIRTDRAPSAAHPLADRLLREARAAAQLGHPAITRVYDFGVTPSGNPYLVMELLTGDDLGSVLAERGTVKPSKAVQILLPIAHALATAHGKGIVHRDVKPANIFLTTTDSGIVQPKLIDFGVAKLEQHALDRVTLAGFQVGSPGYMSPEQARGDDVGADADVWALGVVLYEALTGELPFSRTNYNALMRAIIEDPHAPIARFGIADDALGAIVDRCLDKRRAHRWGSASELGVALARWLADRGYSEDICGASLATTWLSPRIAVRAADVLESIPPGRASAPETGWNAGLVPMGSRVLAAAPVPTFPQPKTRTSIPVVGPASPSSIAPASRTSGAEPADRSRRAGPPRRLLPWRAIAAGLVVLTGAGLWLHATDRGGPSELGSSSAPRSAASNEANGGYARASRSATMRRLRRAEAADTAPARTRPDGRAGEHESGQRR